MADAFYSSPAWRELRTGFLRQFPVCQVPGCGLPSKHADHKVARRRGGAALDPANLMALCHSHHSVKTAGMDGGFGNKPKADYTLRAVGCNTDGWPRDPGHHWRA
jgi:5-methylcytosine-specific restriction endonuclease McrA